MIKSPFPGMDPWLEGNWGDVHTRLTTYASDQLQTQLPPGLRARVEEYVAVEDEQLSEEDSPYFSPDVRVIERPFSSGGQAETGAPVINAAEPVVIEREVESEPETLHFIQIVDIKTGHRIVTSVEFLSPTNKQSKAGRQAYRTKQNEMLDGHVNLVEIDLLRCGESVIALKRIPPNRRSEYQACVVRAHRRRFAEYYQLSLREPLPSIRIPLRPDDDDVVLNLQALIEMTYANGGYDDLDYTAKPVPPLDEPEARWADEVLRANGLR